MIKSKYGVGVLTYSQPFSSILNFSKNTLNILWKPSKALLLKGTFSSKKEGIYALDKWYQDLKEDYNRIKKITMKITKNNR